METKPIQDVVPPPKSDDTPAEPPVPQTVGDIPVRTPTKEAMPEDESPQVKNDDSSFLVPDTSSLSPTAKNKQKSKNSKPRPTLAITVAILALICLAVGVYLKFKT